MKIIKIKLKDKYSYYEYYVNIMLKPFYNLTDTEVKILTLLYEAVNKEVEDGVPIGAAIRLVSGTDVRNAMMSKITVIAKRLGNKEKTIEQPSLHKSFKALRGRGLLGPNFEAKAEHIPSFGDGGFGFKTEIIEEDGK